MNRMIRWLEKNVPTTSNIIDVGCGNGVMCIELYEVGFKNILGVDYSSHAIELAQKIANENENQELKFKVSFFKKVGIVFWQISKFLESSGGFAYGHSDLYNQ